MSHLCVCFLCRTFSRSEESEVSADDFFTGQGSAIAVHRLVSGEAEAVSS